MAIDARFQSLVSEISVSAKNAADHRAEEQRLDSEGVAKATEAFEPVAIFLAGLASALKEGVDVTIELTRDGDWIPSNGRDCYMVFYKLWMPARGLHEVTFYLSSDLKQVEFDNQPYALRDTRAIEDAITEWVRLKLKG